MSSSDEWADQMLAMQAEPLDPELEPWCEPGVLGGRMLRHPLVYDLMVDTCPGLANHALKRKREMLDAAIAEEDWHQVVFLHERPYRFKALIDYCVGTNSTGAITPLRYCFEYTDLATDVWIDSENIEQHEHEWRQLFGNGERLWLGGNEGLAAFDQLPDPIRAYRGGVVGDWSWTTNYDTAEFFSRRSGIPPRSAMIPKADVFGYLLQRGESELLVRLTPERRGQVYPRG